MSLTIRLVERLRQCRQTPDMVIEYVRHVIPAAGAAAT